MVTSVLGFGGRTADSPAAGALSTTTQQPAGAIYVVFCMLCVLLALALAL
jgi:hypothetical protein